MLQATDLLKFTGTESYHRISMNRRVVATDGVKYLCVEGKCFWFADIIASYQPDIIAGQYGEYLPEFQIWELKKRPQDDRQEGDAFVLCKSDSCADDKALIKQNIPYTDFPLDYVKVYAIYDGEKTVILLPSEY